MWPGAGRRPANRCHVLATVLDPANKGTGIRRHLIYVTRRNALRGSGVAGGRRVVAEPLLRRSELRRGKKREEGRDDYGIGLGGHGDFSFNVMRQGLGRCQSLLPRFALAGAPTQCKWPSGRKLIIGKIQMKPSLQPTNRKIGIWRGAKPDTHDPCRHRMKRASLPLPG
jgi:hypothetical protein